jgi:DNA repair protein RecO (recombination protein O)
MPAATPRQPRVQDQPAYVLHRHDWSEASLVLDVFSRTHGRLALVAKGVKRPSSQFRPVLLPLQGLRLSWGGDAEVRTLKSATWAGGHVMPTGDALLAGTYLNELLLRLLARDDPHPPLFDHYAQAVKALVGLEPVNRVLRVFELLLLRELGYLPQLDVEGASLAPLEPGTCYRLKPEAGLHPSGHEGQPGASGLPGRLWQPLQQALDGPDAFNDLLHACAECAGPLREPLRQLLHYHSGVRVFQTRQLMVDAQRLAAAHTGLSARSVTPPQPSSP